MKNKLTIGITTLGILATIGAGSFALAASSDKNPTNINGRGEMRNFDHVRGEGFGVRDSSEMIAKREAAQAAVEASDYNAWVTAVGEDAPILEKINESNFSRFVEAHNLRKQSSDIMTELGLDDMVKPGRMHRGSAK